MSSDFFELLEGIKRAIAQEGEISDRIDAIRDHLENDEELRREFFARLHDPEWIPCLKTRGFFGQPPSAVEFGEGRTGYPKWSASEYLARMANLAPNEVAAIFADLRTNNPWVIGDMLTATQAMPAEIASIVVPAVCRAARSRSLWIFYKDAARLCVKLADSDYMFDAMGLAEALFEPESGADEGGPIGRDQYEYKESLEIVLPTLVRKKPHEFIVMLCNWLNIIIKATKTVERDTGIDHSYMWRPAIEDHDQNRDYDLASVIVELTRRGFDQALDESSVSFCDALGIIERYTFVIFRRLRVYLINRYSELDETLTRQTMMDRSLFDDFRYKHEYAKLMEARLPLLSANEKEEWLRWVDAGPDMSDFDEMIYSNLNREATEDDRQSRISHWKFEKLHWIREYLAGHQKEFYDNMLAERGEPEMADLNFYVGEARWGRESPLSVDELKSGTFDEAVERVSSWTQDRVELEGPTFEGLTSTFGEYVATDVEEFSKQSDTLKGRRPSYVRAFIRQMAEAVKAGRTVDVEQVVGLCQWVITQPGDEEASQEGVLDRDWRWTRDEVSQFVENVCTAQSNEKPRYPLEGLRESLWNLVNTLYRGLSQSYVLRDTTEMDLRTHDYLTMGMNSARGKAVEAGLEYSRWIANHTKQTSHGQEVVPDGFDAMPEVREMLEWQIKEENRSFEALSIIGSRIGLIRWIDAQWLKDKSDELFSLDDIERDPRRAFGWAAWNSFIIWVKPHIAFYKLLKKQFTYAVQHASKVQVPGQSREQPMFRLGEHLMVLYGRGQLTFEDDDGLLKKFIFESIPDIRRHAVGFVGEGLRGEVPPPVVERFSKLWETYWGGIGKEDAAEKPDAHLFGTWISCGKFPNQWALEQLEQYVQAVPVPEPDHAVMEQLAEIAGTDIARSVRILDKMIHGSKESWRVHGWLDQVISILERAMEAGGEARIKALDLINHLGRLGFVDKVERLVNIQPLDPTQ